MGFLVINSIFMLITKLIFLSYMHVHVFCMSMFQKTSNQSSQVEWIVLRTFFLLSLFSHTFRLFSEQRDTYTIHCINITLHIKYKYISQLSGFSITGSIQQQQMFGSNKEWRVNDVVEPMLTLYFVTHNGYGYKWNKNRTVCCVMKPKTKVTTSIHLFHTHARKWMNE